MVVGIDVHKRTHVAALLDERGGEVATLASRTAPRGCGACAPGSSSTTPARRSSVSRARPDTVGCLSRRYKPQGTRC
jgi:hypothetical protein